MPRQIKFRAWDALGKCYFGNREITFKNVINGGASGTRLIQEDKVVWQQFTGLVDKNGKEIYEGDLIRDDLEDEDREDDVSVIVWDNDRGCWTTFPWNGDGMDWDRMEVIGNQYENPKLLEKSNA